MAGHFQKRGNGSYLLVYHVGYDANGKKIRKTRTVKCKNDSEARIKLAKFVTEIELGEYVAPSNVSLNDYVTLWRKERKGKIAPATLETYQYTLDRRILPALGHFKLDSISLFTLLITWRY